MDQLIECIPNISEGRNENIIAQISKIIEDYPQVYLLHKDVGYDANRTVFSLVGQPKAVLNCMYQVYGYCAEKIDMEKHEGTHPRIGAIDVCPFVVVKGIREIDLIPLVKTFAERVTTDLGIPGFLYEFSALAENRKNLEYIRSGQYEKLSEKLLLEEWKTDVGPVIFNSKFGATVIGVRKYLLAYNVNLNTEDEKIALNIARKIRTSGYVTKDEQGIKYRKRGKLKAVKALGWFVDEYEMAQVSTNIVDIDQTTLADVFEACREEGKKYDVTVLGSEIIGLVPLKAMTDAGKFYLKENNSSDQKLISAAIQNLGLEKINPFIPEERILEYVLSNAINQ
jgi:glutamate formiminotransferase/formiminotetrahydrofolate cyclodeaminase